MKPARQPLTRHELKTWPEPFEEILRGRKRHEVRRADRPFAVGDELRLREWDPAWSRYTGRELSVRVTYLSPGGTWGLPADLCVMSVEVFGRKKGCRTKRTHAVQALDPQPYVGDGGRRWTSLASGDEVTMQRFAERLRADGREVRVLEIPRRRGGKGRA